MEAPILEWNWIILGLGCLKPNLEGTRSSSGALKVFNKVKRGLPHLVVVGLRSGKSHSGD